MYDTIPLDILEIQMDTWDGLLTLKEMLDDCVSQPILSCRYDASMNEFGNLQLHSFTAWSEDEVYILIYAVGGYIVIKEKRGY